MRVEKYDKIIKNENQDEHGLLRLCYDLFCFSIAVKQLI